ncbi:MAG: hypothetical protein AAF696_32705, partial [Bacteroidota bacterium]
MPAESPTFLFLDVTIGCVSYSNLQVLKSLSLYGEFLVYWATIVALIFLPAILKKWIWGKGSNFSELFLNSIFFILSLATS